LFSYQIDFIITLKKFVLVFAIVKFYDEAVVEK